MQTILEGFVASSGKCVVRENGDQGVRLQHASTGKILTVTRCSSFSFSSHFSSNDYPESWGEGLHEVVAAEPNKDCRFSPWINRLESLTWRD